MAEAIREAPALLDAVIDALAAYNRAAKLAGEWQFTIVRNP